MENKTKSQQHPIYKWFGIELKTQIGWEGSDDKRFQKETSSDYAYFRQNGLQI